MTYSSDLEAASSDQLVAARDIIVAIMDENHPSKGWAAGGVLEGVVIEPLATGLARLVSESDSIRAANSLSTAVAAGDTAAVDRLLQNYFVVRSPATPSQGSVQIITTADTIVSIPVTAVFVIGTIEFHPVIAYRIYPSGSGRNDPAAGILSFTPREGGTFGAVISLVSVETGSITRVVRGAAFDTGVGIPGVRSIAAVSDFIGGVDAQAVSSAVADAKAGITPATVSSYAGIKNVVSKLFPGSSAGVVGAGHAAMVRDRDSIFGISTGGKADVYVKTAASVSTLSIAVQATMYPADRGGKVWEFSYSLPGAYRVTAIRPEGISAVGGYTPDSEVISAVPPATGFIPKLSSTDAVFTAHQRRVVRFTADDLNYAVIIGPAAPNVAITKTFVVDIMFMPMVAEIDAALRDFDRRDPGLDVLVRGATPVVVDVSVVVRGIVDVEAARSAIVSAIAALQIGTSVIPASLVYDAIRPLVTGNVGTVVFRAEVTSFSLRPVFINAKSELTIPDAFAAGVCADSIAFLTSNDRISIEVS